MCAFVDDTLFDTGQTVEDDRAMATANIVKSALGSGEGDGGRDGPPIDSGTDVGHCGEGLKRLGDEEVVMSMSSSLGYKGKLGSLRSTRSSSRSRARGSGEASSQHHI